MRASRWAAFGASVALAACGGAIAPTGGDGDAGDAVPVSASSSGSTSSGSSGSSGSASGSGGVGGGTSGSGGPSSSGSGNGSTSSGGVSVDAAFACSNGSPPPMTGNVACDECVEGSCGDSWCACSADSTLDDAGMAGGCLGYVNCIVACLNGDAEAGIPPSNLSMCAMLCAPPYGPQQQQEGQALITCLASSCETPATCGQ